MPVRFPRNKTSDFPRITIRGLPHANLGKPR